MAANESKISFKRKTKEILRMLAKFSKTLLFAMGALFVMSVTAMAQDGAAERATSLGWGWLGAGIGAGLATIGGAAGIGKLAASAMEGTARQPEAGGDIRVTMIIAAALIEGFTFFAIFVAFSLAGLK